MLLFLFFFNGPAGPGSGPGGEGAPIAMGGMDLIDDKALFPRRRK